MDPDRTPVVVAAAQLACRDRETGAADLAVQAAEGALGSSLLREAIERVSVVNILARSGGRAPASEIATRLGLRAARCETTTVGGTTPQWLVERAAEDIAAGSLSAVLIAGAEAVRSGRLKPPPESGEPRASDVREPEGEADPVIGDQRPGCSDDEIAAGLFVPVYVYPVFESALARRSGRDLLAQRRFAAAAMAPLTSVAAANPHAWFPIERSAEEIASVSEANRLVAEPYTKLMTAFLGGSQAASIVVTSLSVARSVGLDEGAMFILSSAVADDVWSFTARPDLASSPAASAAGRAALGRAGLGIDEIEHLDVYSCFPSALQIGAESLGVELDDRRSLTVTGGLPYFGGPGSSYGLHAIATLFERLRDRGGHGLATGVSWFMTKHATGCFSSSPLAGGYGGGGQTPEQGAIDATALAVVPREEDLLPTPALVDGATVIYGRNGEVSAAPVIATLADGRRVAAAVAAEDLPGLAGRGLAGETVVVAGRPPRYRTS